MQKLTEVLYEPDVPWFKCISQVYQKETVCETIVAILGSIVDDDADIIDEEDTGGGDVAIVADDPKVMPWATHTKSDWCDLGFSDASVFPEPLSSVAFKRLYRGLETSRQKLSLEQLLSRCREILGPVIAESSTTDFYTIDSCPVSCNMSHSLVYIGSNESQSALETVVSKLNTLVEISVSRLCQRLDLLRSSFQEQYRKIHALNSYQRSRQDAICI